MASLVLFLPSVIIHCTPHLSIRLRFDALFQRCRLITLEESVRMIKALEVIAKESQHTSFLIEGLRDLTIIEAEHHLLELEKIISECETRYLKRLQCEALLLCSCFQLVLRELGVDDATNNTDLNLHRARTLCQTFPDSAGLLSPIYLAIQRSMDSKRKDVETLYAKECKDIFWSWPKHHTGALTKCLHGHVYSSRTWSDCPECGREIEKPENLPVIPLQAEDFVLAMRTVPAAFDATAYRCRLSRDGHRQSKAQSGKHLEMDK